MRGCMLLSRDGNHVPVRPAVRPLSGGLGAASRLRRLGASAAAAAHRRLAGWAASGVRRTLRRVPVGRRVRRLIAERSLEAGWPVVRRTMRAGHELVLDLRSEAQRDAYVTGRFDEPIVGAAQQMLTPHGSVAIDVGANVGLWTVPLARSAATNHGMVLAFEPVPRNVQHLRANVALNRLDGVVRILPFALSDRDGTADITLREDFCEGATSGNAALVIDDGQDERFRTLEVRLRRLDDVTGSLPGPVAIMKIDVEGHEDHVLAGGRRTIAADRPVIVVEWNPVYHERRGTDPSERLHAAMSGLGYLTVRLEGNVWIVEDRFYSPKDIDNLVLCPREKTSAVLEALRADAAPRRRGRHRNEEVRHAGHA